MFMWVRLISYLCTRISKINAHMINTNELMLGDLICNHRHWACLVVEIFDDRVTVISHHYRKETFKGEDLYLIDLDDDFFKRNGFIDFVANQIQMVFVDKENDLSIHVIRNQSIQRKEKVPRLRQERLYGRQDSDVLCTRVPASAVSSRSNDAAESQGRISRRRITLLRTETNVLI